MTDPIKRSDGIYLYSDRQLLEILHKMPLNRKARLLARALNFMEENSTTKIMAIAIALKCAYDECSGRWLRKSKLKIS